MASPLSQFSFFHHLAEHIKVDRHHRVELSTANLRPDLVEAVLDLTISCCRCGATIHPFRRRGRPERMAPSTADVFVSLVCPMSESPGCSRAKAAERAKATLIEDVRDAHADDYFETMRRLLEIAD